MFKNSSRVINKLNRRKKLKDKSHSEVNAVYGHKGLKEAVRMEHPLS